MNKNILQAIGIGAFIIGGMLTRVKAMDAAETLEERYFSKDEKKPVCENTAEQ